MGYTSRRSLTNLMVLCFFFRPFFIDLQKPSLSWIQYLLACLTEQSRARCCTPHSFLLLNFSNFDYSIAPKDMFQLFSTLKYLD